MKLKIVLIEDTPQSVQDLLPALESEAGKNGTVKLFVPPKSAKATGPFEERLEKDLIASDFSNFTLIVADRDLSKTKSYRGLSESIVKRVADSLGIPECAYARGEKAEEFVKNAESREGRIAVSVKDGPNIFAKQVVSVADGFGRIAQRLPVALKSSDKQSPAKLLAHVIGKPEYAEKISLYSSGDQNRLASVLRVRGNSTERRRQLMCLLGYWLWDSVLRYPGVVVNETAASSFLNISEGEFRDNQAIKALFTEALYEGPFCVAKGPLWWRGMLEDIVADAKCTDGREFAATKLKKEIGRSECCEDKTKPAGYYCMLSKKPVSLENSHGGLAWFPRGADLARVSRTSYDELGPWLTA